MPQEIWKIDDIDRPDRPTPAFLEIGDQIVVTTDEQGSVTVEIPDKVPPLPPLSGTRRVQGWFHWIEGYVYVGEPTNGTVYTFHAFPRVNGQKHWLEGFVERIVITDGELGEVRDTETWTAMKQPPELPGDE